jgi:GT2 family glycosyltransferase/organic radical activating enzyme
MAERAIRAFRENEPKLEAEIILIDNNSEKKLNSEIIAELNVEYIENSENLGFAKAVNQGIKIGSEAEYILLLNSDVLIKNRSITKIISVLDKNKEIGICGPKFLYPDGDYQISAGFLLNLRRLLFSLTALYKIFPFGHYLNKGKIFKKNIISAQEVDWLSGGCLLIKNEVIKKIGLLDENYFFGFEDIDFCLCAKSAGYKIIYYPEAEVVHYHALSSGGLKSLWRIRKDKEGIEYFFKKNYPKKKITRYLIGWIFAMKINLFSFFTRKIKKYMLLDATIAITYKCNSRCRMCNIWQAENPKDLPLAYFLNLSPDLKYINLSGGEPFLRNDLDEIVKIVKQASPKAQIIISSNGLATDLIAEKMKKILEIDKKIGVRISLDGIGETHNKVRGITNIYDSALNTIEKLKKIGVKNLGLSFTIMDFNAEELPKVYDLSRNLGVELAIALVQNSDIYFSKSDNKINKIEKIENSLNYVIKKELASFSPKRWLRAYYNYGLLYYAKYRERLLPSGAGFDSSFISPDGDIFPSNLINLKVGNLSGGKLDDIWQAKDAEIARKRIEDENISESWIICTIRGEMKKNIFKIIFWIIKNKFFRFYENPSN